MPTSSTATAPRTVERVEALLGRFGSGPRRTSSRKPRTPTRSASERKYAQRTTCSARVGPDAPTASVGGGAARGRRTCRRPRRRGRRSRARASGRCRRRAAASAAARDHVRVGAARATPETTRPLAAGHDRVRQRLHALVEVQPHLARRVLEALLELRRRRLHGRVGECRGGRRERDQRDEQSARLIGAAARRAVTGGRRSARRRGRRRARPRSRRR